MSTVERYLANSRFPGATIGGKLMLLGMNTGHYPLYRFALSLISFNGRETVLDVGCGGGRFLSLLSKRTSGRVIGVDHSPHSVAKSREINRRAVAEGRVEVRQAEVSALPVADGQCDLVTAIETVYFWPDIEHDLAEVRRVLAPGGHLVIANEIADAESGRMWSERIDMTVYDPEELRGLLEKAGFTGVEIHRHGNGHYVAFVAENPGPSQGPDPDATRASSTRPTGSMAAGPDGVDAGRADYANWIPAWLPPATAAGGVAMAGAGVGLAMGPGRTSCAGRVAAATSGVAAGVALSFAAWMAVASRFFDYNRDGGVARPVVDGVARHVTCPDGGTILDVGCGSGALTIACAKLNPGAKVIGVDRWGPEYADYGKELCEANARAEGVDNCVFRRGDAMRLDLPDDSVDAVTSNYVYHNIAGVDKRQLLLETLRVLKKGGTFAIHDLMGPMRYGDMRAFVRRLEEEGYREVRLIDTADGLFMDPVRATFLGLRGSRLLVGRK